MRFVSVCILTVLLFSVSWASSSSDKDIVKNIRKIYSHTNQIVKNNKAKVIIIYSESGKDGYDIKNWHLIGDKQNYEKGAYEVRVFVVDKNIVKTRIITQSLSGDWAYVVEYYYYGNTNVAFIYEGNTTYNGYIVVNGEKTAPEGPFIVEKRSYFSEDGKRVRYIEKAFLKLSKKSVPTEQIQNIDPEKYDSICLLPFIDLIKDKINVKCENAKSTG